MKALALTTALVIAFTAAARAEDKSSPLPDKMPVAKEACFGRDYDASHLAAHLQQRVTSLYLFRDFTPDPNAEVEYESPATLRDNDGSDGRINLDAYVRLRDRKGVYTNTFSCSHGDGGDVLCAIDCDGGSFRLSSRGDGLELHNEGFVVVGGCGASETDQSHEEHVQPGADDKIFRLTPRPIAACAAIRDAQRPAFANLGKPIRQRLATKGTQCFARSYDAAHLASHPQQKVRRITVTKAASEGGNAPAYRLTVRLELRDGSRHEAAADCAPDGYSYLCTGTTEADGAREFYLTRAGDSDIMLRDRRGMMAAMLKAQVGGDDHLFKLSKSPEAACGI